MKVLEVLEMIAGSVPDFVPDSRVDNVAAAGVRMALRAVITLIKRRGFDEAVAILKRLADTDASSINLDEIVAEVKADLSAEG